MTLAERLSDLYDRLSVGCLQLSRFQQMTIDVAANLSREGSVTDVALAALEEYLSTSTEPALVLQVEETGSSVTLSRSEAAYLHRLTTMGMEIELRYPRLANSMILIYLTTIFEAYVLDVTREFLLATARNLRQPGAPSQAPNQLLMRLVRQQVTDLGFGPIQAKLRFVSETLGVDLRSGPAPPAEIDEYYATRNLLVHNGGIVNRKYLSVVHGSTLRVGEVRPVGDEYVRSAINALQRTGEYVYSVLLRRYAGEDPATRLEQARRLNARLAAVLAPHEGGATSSAPS